MNRIINITIEKCGHCPNKKARTIEEEVTENFCEYTRARVADKDAINSDCPLLREKNPNLFCKRIDCNAYDSPACSEQFSTTCTNWKIEEGWLYSKFGFVFNRTCPMATESPCYALDAIQGQNGYICEHFLLQPETENMLCLFGRKEAL